MPNEAMFSKLAAKAILDDRAESLVERSASGSEFWAWLGGRSTDIRLFLGIGQHAPTSGRSRLPVHRQLLLQQYQLARARVINEPGEPTLVKLDAIRSGTQQESTSETDLAWAASEVLDWSYRSGFLDDAHVATFLYYFLYSARWSEMSERVCTVISRIPDIFNIPGFLPIAAGTYGIRLLELLVSACLKSDQNKKMLAEIIESSTGRRRWGREPGEYARETLSWCRASEGRIVFDVDSLYPAPPAPVFKLEATDPGSETTTAGGKHASWPELGSGLRTSQN